MSFLNVCFQDASLANQQQLEKFKSACSQSDFDIVCIMGSFFNKTTSDQEIFDTDIFDIFRLCYEREEQNYWFWETFIAVRKDLSPYVRRDWKIEGVECVWITVSSRGSHCLHFACGYFLPSANIHAFTETLASLRKNHPHDQFLVVGEFPSRELDFISEKHCKTGPPQNSTTIKPGNEIIKILPNSISLPGLVQFNIRDEHDYFGKLVFSSIPITGEHFADPLAPEVDIWNMAVQFGLNIGPPECCQATNNATKKNCRNKRKKMAKKSNAEKSGQHEASQKDVKASGDVTQMLVQKERDEVTKVPSKNFVLEKCQQTVKKLNARLEECGRILKENVSAKSDEESLRGWIDGSNLLEQRALAPWTNAVITPTISSTSNPSRHFQPPRTGFLVGPAVCPKSTRTPSSKSSKTAYDKEKLTTPITFPVSTTYNEPARTAFLLSSTSCSTTTGSVLMTSALGQSDSNVTTNNISTKIYSVSPAIGNIMKFSETSDRNEATLNRETTIDANTRDMATINIVNTIGGHLALSDLEILNRNEPISEIAAKIDTNAENKRANDILKLIDTSGGYSIATFSNVNTATGDEEFKYDETATAVKSDKAHSMHDKTSEIDPQVISQTVYTKSKIKSLRKAIKKQREDIKLAATEWDNFETLN